MKNIRPPRLAEKLFNWYCGQAKVDDLRGDMEEWFHLQVERHSLFRARLFYWRQVLSLITSYAVRKRKKDSRVGLFASSTFSAVMLRNYLTVAVRNLYRHKYFTIVNATGLAIGMSITLLFLTMLIYVHTFDDFHRDKDKIFRVITSYQKGLDQFDLASASVQLADKIKSGVAGIDQVTRINSNFSGEAIVNELHVPIRGFYADPSFLSIFTFPLEEGSTLDALTKPNSIVLTQSAAQKLFGNTPAFGKTISILNQGDFLVTGILKDLPKNTHLDFESLVSYATLPPGETGDVIQYDGPFAHGLEFVYFKVKDANQLSGLTNYLQIISRQASKNSDASIDFQLQALTDITPGRDLAMLTGGLGPQWDYPGFYIFGTICLLILLPACFNYTNISIARAIKRAKEIGLRKTLGSQRQQIFIQFISETVVVTTLSLIGAIGLFFLTRSEFQGMMVAASSLDLSLTWTTGIAFVLFAVITGLIAGTAPALYFARLNPIQALRNQNTRRGFSVMWLRKGLTIFQFVLSFGFIVALIVFSRQYRYSMNYDFGFQRENILDIPLRGTDPALFSSEFSKLSSVHSISFSSDVLGLHHSAGDSWMQFDSRADSFQVNEMFVDANYVENLGLKLIAGSTFPNEVWNREQHILVNEQFLHQFSIDNPRDAIGKVVRVENKDLEIIGVLKDFHFSSLREPIKSFAFRMHPDRYERANLKVSFTDVYYGISEMEKVWKRINPENSMVANFMNDQINGAYEFYRTLMKIIGFLGFLAISISLLGMLGMVVYTAETRTKEVGIRKVMGASVGRITLLLSKDYLKLMGVACLLALPLTVVMVDKTLSNMQHYHVTLSYWDVLLGLVIMFALGIATIASQTFKAANANPADTLRME
jgi:ABC-type antimicrobial peptide transport system permease subunit